MEDHQKIEEHNKMGFTYFCIGSYKNAINEYQNTLTIKNLI